MKNWKIVLGIFLLTIFSACLLNKNIESFTDPKGDLYLLLEAPGFNVPELKHTKQIMDPNLAQSKFNNVVVVANSAKYKNPRDNHIMNEQWNNTLVSNLGLPVKKWAFVCCNSRVTPANYIVNMLITEFPDLEGFLIDSEDDPSSIAAFVKLFNNMGAQYKYAIVGGLRNSIPPASKYGIIFDKFFAECYTEGSLGQYNFYKGLSGKQNGATCVDLNDAGIEKFWNSVKSKLGDNESIVPTVCGSGNCQEELFGNDCFDERLSNKNINSLITKNNSGRKDFAIWYGTGQQFSCMPSRDCLRITDATSCNNSVNCSWSPYKKNPNTGQKGVCFGNTDKLWGCATTWQ